MSDYIPFEIQSEIIKMLPVKSLLQFRSVSKQWKSFIDDPEFIKTYHVNRTNPEHRLLVTYRLSSTLKTYTSIIDNNNTFPQHKFPLTAPDSLGLIRDPLTLDSVHGLFCFFGFYGDVKSRAKMAVIWNPTVRKSVAIHIPPHKPGYNHTRVGFGVCPDTSDPKLVKISVSYRSSWEVDVFSLSTRVWKTVYAGPPFRLCYLMPHQVFVNGVIYFRASNLYHANQVMSNFVISYDIKSDKFGEVCLPERFVVRTPYVEIDVVKVNGSLGLLEYYTEGGMRVCGVWTRTDDANKTFSKIYTVKVGGESSLNRVLGFRNKGEVVIEVMDDDDNNRESRIEVYEPLSGHTVGVGINGKQCMFSAKSYMETLLLLHESNSIIH